MVEGGKQLSAQFVMSVPLTEHMNDHPAAQTDSPFNPDCESRIDISNISIHTKVKQYHGHARTYFSLLLPQPPFWHHDQAVPTVSFPWTVSTNLHSCRLLPASPCQNGEGESSLKMLSRVWGMASQTGVKYSPGDEAEMRFV